MLITGGDIVFKLAGLQVQEGSLLEQHPHHLDLITRKVQEKLTGKDEVIFAPEEVAGTSER